MVAYRQEHERSHTHEGDVVYRNRLRGLFPRGRNLIITAELVVSARPGYSREEMCDGQVCSGGDDCRPDGWRFGLAQVASGPTPPAGQESPKLKETLRSVVRGDVLSVDIEAKTLTVQAKKGSELISVVVETDPQTQFVLNDKAATLVDLRAGMKVTVLPDVGIATKVTAKSVKQPPKLTAGKSRPGERGQC